MTVVPLCSLPRARTRRGSWYVTFRSTRDGGELIRLVDVFSFSAFRAGRCFERVSRLPASSTNICSPIDLQHQRHNVSAHPPPWSSRRPLEQMFVLRRSLISSHQLICLPSTAAVIAATVSFAPATSATTATSTTPPPPRASSSGSVAASTVQIAGTAATFKAGGEVRKNALATALAVGVLLWSSGQCVF